MGVFNKKKENIHRIWDTSMILRRLSTKYNSNPEDLAKQLIKNIDERKFAYKDADSWIEDVDKQYGSVNSLGHWVVPITWAGDSNSYNCQVVWPSYDANPQQDLSKQYYDNAIDIVEIALARAGYRIAAILNRALSSC